MKINYLSVKEGTPASGYWDQQMLQDFFDQFPSTGDRDVVVIPGAYQGKPEYYRKINEELQKYKKVMVIVTSDEEGNFDCSELSHPDMIVYSQYGTSENIFPLGYAPGTRELLKKLGSINKVFECFFSGQITHPIREEMADAISLLDGGLFLPTDGFAKGINHDSYMALLALAKIAPAPPGPISHDSFRLYEALEAGCIPVVSNKAPGGRKKFWERLFGQDQFIPSCNEYKSYIFHGWTQEMANEMFARWQAWKYAFQCKLKKQLGCPGDDITVIMPTSPIKSHPSTEIIDQTIASVRNQMDSTIFVLIDGVRYEQEEYQERYTEYVRRLLWKCNFEYKNVVPLFFPKHEHQSGMMKQVIKSIESPLILFMEHDTPLVDDWPFDWDHIKKVLLEGTYNVVRFHYESFIPKEHEHLMVGSLEGVFQRTIQFSARPHVARRDFYEKILENFSENSNCFIEDKAYGVIVEAPWEDWRVAIYHPGNYIKRSINLDGRAGDKKYESEQIF